MKLPVWAINTLRWVSLVALLIVSWDIAKHAIEMIAEGGHGHEAHGHHDHHGHEEHMELWKYGVIAAIIGFSVWLWNGPCHKYCGCSIFDTKKKFESPKFLMIALAGFGLHQLIEGAAMGFSMGIESVNGSLVMIGFLTHGIFDVLVAIMFFFAFETRWKGVLALAALVGARVLGHYLGHDVEELLPSWVMGILMLLVVFLLGMFIHVPKMKKNGEACCDGKKHC